jgi:hypothetical protein
MLHQRRERRVMKDSMVLSVRISIRAVATLHKLGVLTNPRASLSGMVAIAAEQLAASLSEDRQVTSIIEAYQYIKEHGGRINTKAKSDMTRGLMEGMRKEDGQLEHIGEKDMLNSPYEFGLEQKKYKIKSFEEMSREERIDYVIGTIIAEYSDRDEAIPGDLVLRAEAAKRIVKLEEELKNKKKEQDISDGTITPERFAAQEAEKIRKQKEAFALMRPAAVEEKT